jgi:hypothetical protein
VKINTNLKRLIREYEFLLEDIDDVLEIHKAANQELNRAIRMAKEDDIAESEFEKEDEEEEVETFEDTPERKVLKSLFRKIVFKCHPDQLPKELSEIEKAKMQDLYEKAVIAHDRDNWGLMVVVAIKLDVKLPKEAEDMVGRISEETEGLKKQITQLTGSFAWQWYHAQEDLQKKMVSDYLNTLKMIKEKKALMINKPKKILVVGHPRTGTGYTAKLLQSWGLDIGHETMGEDGTSDWSLATRERSLWQDLNFGDYEWDTIIYCVRDPKDSIPSIVYTEDIKKDSFDYRMRWGKFKDRKRPLMNTISSILAWDELIQKIKPSFIFKIESDGRALFQFLIERGFKINWSEGQIGKKYNQRYHDGLENILKDSRLLSHHKSGINVYCEKYGYSKIFD